jgi:pimeloyl-ACP methyl ester carboxylesterase
MQWVLLAVGIIIVLFIILGEIAFNASILRKKKKKTYTEEIYINREKLRAKNNAFLFSHNPQDVSIINSDGIILRGWYAPADKPTKRFVIFSHGYGCNGPDEFSHMFEFYHGELGFNCLYPDHMAHGRSGGKYIGFGALDYKDILLWVGYLIGRFGDNIEIVLHGISMGAATVMLVNEADPPEQVKFIIEDCGYTNAREEVSNTLKNLIGIRFEPLVMLVSLLCKINAGYYLGDADCIGKMPLAKKPILFIHGGSDTFVPTEMGLRLYEACTVPKDLLIVKGAIHAFSYYDDKEAYQAKIKEFVGKYLKEPASADIK